MLVNEFIFKEELLKRIHQILRSNEEFDSDSIPSDNIPKILIDISREIDKLTNPNEKVDFGM